MQFRAIIVASAFYFLAAAPGRSDENADYRVELNGGYFLLHNLYADEAQLPILLDLKTAPQELQDFAVKISKTAKEDTAELERMRDADPRMSWDKNPLPKIEQAVRASIKAEKQHQLLFGTKDQDFARALLVSQAEASKYAANIAKVLAEEDKNPDHVRDLKRMSVQWHALYDESFRLLRNY